MQKARRTRRQQLVIDGELRLPVSLFDFEKFREWRYSYRYPGIIKASYLGGMVYIETGMPVRFQLLTRGDADYEPVKPDDEGYRYSAVFQRRFRIVRRTNPVGRYDYRLLHRKSSQ